MRVQFNGRIPAFQAGRVGSIPITRSIFMLAYFIRAHSSAGQSNCLLSSRPQVRVLLGAPIYGGYSSVGQSARLWLWRSWVRLSLSTPFSFYNGLQPSGKATDFDSVIPMVRIHPAQPFRIKILWLQAPVFYILGCRQAVRQRTLTPSFRRFESFHPSQSPKGISLWGLLITYYFFF